MNKWTMRLLGGNRSNLQVKAALTAVSDIIYSISFIEVCLVHNPLLFLHSG